MPIWESVQRCCVHATMQISTCHQVSWKDITGSVHVPLLANVCQATPSSPYTELISRYLSNGCERFFSVNDNEASKKAILKQLDLQLVLSTQRLLCKWDRVQDVNTYMGTLLDSAPVGTPARTPKNPCQKPSHLSMQSLMSSTSHH